MKINFHSCGSIEEIMDDLIECGVDVLNPVQTSAANMDPKRLKERYGKDIVFWGGAYDAQTIDPSASYEEVYRTVYDNIKIFAEGGNYIFSGVHNMPPLMPDHHLKAMLDAYHDAK
jgi:uroporphyrinogen decarboxylase